MTNAIASAVTATSASGASQEHLESKRTLEDVKRELRLSRWDSLLLWFCKADLYALRMATYETRLQFEGFGYLVLITAMLACASMFFALSSTVFKGDPLVALAAAGLYATAILFIEREIVDPSKTNVMSLIFRAVMAVIIALVISFPFEMKILESRINEQIRQTTNERHKPLRLEQEAIGVKADGRNSAAIIGLNREIERLERLEQSYFQAYETERQIGSAAFRYGPRTEAWDRKLKGVAAEIAEKRVERDAFKQRFNGIEKARIAEIDAYINTEVDKLTDPLSRLEALNDISKVHPEAFWMTILLKAFFVILELMPALMKFLAPKTEYTFYVEGRRALNEAKINIPINYVIQQMQDNPEVSWKQFRQILDLIEHGIEDRQTVPSRNLDEILNASNLSKNLASIGTPHPTPSSTPCPDTPPVTPVQNL